MDAKKGRGIKLWSVTLGRHSEPSSATWASLESFLAELCQQSELWACICLDLFLKSFGRSSDQRMELAEGPKYVKV